MGTTHLGAPGPPGAPWWFVLPSKLPSGTFLAQHESFGPEKIHKKFRYIWTLFGIDFLRCKKTSKKQQLALGTGATS